MNQFADPVIEAIYARRSVRRYTGQAVEPEKIDMLLKAAMAAPSACNIQPWEFIVASDPDVVEAVRGSIARWANYNAPLIIVVCSYTPHVPWDGNPAGIEDCCAAMENMLITAPVLGLGSVWIGGFDRDALRRILQIPAPVVPVAMAYFGYPAEQHAPRTQYLAEAVHWQRYDSERPHPPRPGNILVDQS